MDPRALRKTRDLRIRSYLKTEVKNDFYKNRPGRFGFSLPRAFQQWSQKCRNPSGSLANYFFVGYTYWTSNPAVVPWFQRWPNKLYIHGLIAEQEPANAWDDNHLSILALRDVLSTARCTDPIQTIIYPLICVIVLITISVLWHQKLRDLVTSLPRLSTRTMTIVTTWQKTVPLIEKPKSYLGKCLESIIPTNTSKTKPERQKLRHETSFINQKYIRTAD